MNQRSIVITGGSRGIGLAIAKKFAKEGWNIALCSKNSEKLDFAKENILEINSSINILTEKVDVSDKEAVLSFGKKCLQELKTIDILVNNAGVYSPGMISDGGFEDNLEGLIQTNLYSAYWLGKIIIPEMIKKRCGHIINISSIAGLQAYPNGGGYSISKFALTGYIKALREELKTKNIRVTGVYPGAVLTDSWAGSDLPPTRFIAASDIAELIYTTHHLSSSACVEDIVIRPTEGDI